MDALSGHDIADQIAKVYISSRDCVENDLESPDPEIRVAVFQKHEQEWKTAKHKVQPLTMTEGTRVPPFLMAHYINTAAGHTRKFRPDNHE